MGGIDPTADDSASTIPRVIGRYAIHDEIASGGMATVHIGRLLGPVGFNRTVAFKRLHDQYVRDVEFVSMFLDEARLAARIHHPNVVSTLDVVTSGRELFLVMEYVPGESLSRLVRAAAAQAQPIPVSISLAVMAGVLMGLHAAHDAKNERGVPLNIVHRDVSPQNILVGADGIPRVLDFGIAMAGERIHTTRAGEVKGKSAYLAPEQLMAMPVDRRTDVFAAGIVLWETLTGQRLFLGESVAKTYLNILDRPAPAPSSVVPGISPELDEIVLRALNIDPPQRFATAQDMALALEHAGNLATSRQVGAWVERMAGEALAERASVVARVELQSSPADAAREIDSFRKACGSDLAESSAVRHDITFSGTPSASRSGTPSPSRSGTRSTKRPQPKRLNKMVFGGILISVVVGGIAFFALSRRHPAAFDSPTASATSAQAPSRAATSASAPAVSAPAPSASSAPVPNASPLPSVARTTTKSRPPPATTRSKPPKSSNCTPPYVVDSRGIHIPKPECL